MCRFVGVELRHDFAGEQFEAFADVFVRVVAGLVEQDNLVDMRDFEFAEFVADGFRGADEAAAERAGGVFRIGAFPFVVFVPQIDGAGFGAFAAHGLAVEAQRELKEGGAVGAAAGFLVGFGAHEVADEGDVGVWSVVGQAVHAFGE